MLVNMGPDRKSGGDRITYPSSGRPSRPASGYSGVEPPEIKPLQALAIYIPTSATVPNLNGNFMVSDRRIEDEFQVTRRVRELVPLSQAPALDFRQISQGGGRTIGGGMSKEARRRAKQKVKRERGKT